MVPFFAYGIALLDNALLQPLAEVCAQAGRYEFMLTIAPLKVIGGTGSPANPLPVLDRGRRALDHGFSQPMRWR